MIAGAGIGAIGGALKRKPMAYKMADQVTDMDFRKQYAGDTLGYLQDMSSGNKPLMSQAEINMQLTGSRGRLAGDMAAERMRIAERALGRQGRMGGMAEASMAALGREGLGQSRQLEAGVQNSLAQQAPGLRLQAAGMGLGQINADQDRYLDEYHRKFAQDAQRQQFSRFGNILGGAVSGASSMSGLGGLFGGGGGGMQMYGGMGNGSGSSAGNAAGPIGMWRG